MSAGNKAKGMADKLDLVGALVAIVLGIMLLVDILNLEIILGIALVVIGIIALIRNV